MDPRPENPPTLPELLTEIAELLEAKGFDSFPLTCRAAADRIESQQARIDGTVELLEAAFSRERFGVHLLQDHQRRRVLAIIRDTLAAEVGEALHD
jgi:hypothetical protein